MTWPTHTLLGINSLWLLAPLPPEALSYDFGVLAACAALGALLPDLDASQSKIKHLRLLGTNFKPFLLPAQIIHRSDQHRGLPRSRVGSGNGGSLHAAARVLGRLGARCITHAGLRQSPTRRRLGQKWSEAALPKQGTPPLAVSMAHHDRLAGRGWSGGPATPAGATPVACINIHTASCQR